MSKLLRDAGEALYGPLWQTNMARALNISDRTVRRWVAGDEDLPAGVAADLWRLCEERSFLLYDVIERLKMAATPR